MPEEIILRLDRVTAEDLYAELHMVGEHFAAGAPITAWPPDSDERLGRLLRDLGHRLGRPCSPHCDHLPPAQADSGLQIRAGTKADVPVVLALLDGATEWLSAQGRTGQWGTRAQSTDPRRIEQVTNYATPGGLWIATHRDTVKDVVVGALAVGAAGPGIPAANEPELFIRLLVTDRTRGGQGIGAALLDHARRLGRNAGVSLVRVDCYAGGDGKLVRYYESQGFTRTETFNRNGWPGQVLAMRL